MGFPLEVTTPDLDRHKQIEQALRESEERFRLLTENSHQVFWITNTDGTEMIYVSPAYAEVWGRSCQSLYERPFSFLDAIHPEDRARVVTVQWQSPHGGYEVEYRIARPDGSLRWIRSRAFPVLNDQCVIHRVVGISEDITARKEAEINLRTQKRLFENLVAVARATTELPSLEDTLQNTIAVAVALTGAMRGSMFLVDPAGRLTHSMVFRGKQPGAAPDPERVELVMAEGLAGWVVRERQPALIIDTMFDDRWLDAPGQSYLARSALAVPILNGKEMLGVITLLHEAANHFSLDHLNLMQAAADQMALALRNAQVLEQAQRLSEVMYMLNHINRAALEANNFEEMVQTLADRLGELLNADNCYLTLWDEMERKTILAAAGAERAGYPTLAVEPDEPTLTAAALKEERVLVVEDLLNSPYLSRRLAEQFSAHSMLAVPLIARNQKLGAALIGFNQPHRFAPDEISLSEQAGRQTALAIANAMLYKTIADQHGRLQALIESSRDGILLIGIDRRVLICNHTLLSLLNVPGLSKDWMGQPARRLIKTLFRLQPRLIQALLPEMRRIQHGAEPSNEGECEAGARWIHWLNLPVQSNQAPLGRLIVLRDVTEERSLDKLRRDLTHMLVHDLRSPLTAVMGAAETLDDRKVVNAPNDYELLAMIRDGAARMLGLVDAILDVSQLENKQMPVEYGAVSLAELAAETLQLQIGLLEKKRLHLHNDVRPDLPPVWVDARLIERVLQNLIHNAIKFTPAEGTVRLTAEISETAPGMLLVTVSDTGPGVPPAIRSRLFEKFVKGSHRDHGSGLGLAFCRLVVEAHGGRIWAEDATGVVGRGATFRFTLPLHQPGDKVSS